MGYEEGRGFVSEGGSSGREVVVAEVSVDDESDLSRGDLALPEHLRLSGFGLLPRHCCYTQIRSDVMREREREKLALH